LTDHRFHNSGVGWNPDTHEFDDEGRYNVTRATDHKGHFKTPTLRDVAKHPPYMHDGSMPSLFSVLEHYNAGGSANPGLSPEIQPLALSMQEMEAVVLFLESLNGPGSVDQGPAYFPQ
jgi:cytochrome c peroxidase